MLEAFKSLQDEVTSFQKTKQSEVEVDQISASAFKPSTSDAVNLDPPHLRPWPTSHSEDMEVDYGPSLSPHLGAGQPWWRPVIDQSRLNTFLLIEKFKMETPESIRTSLIPPEWVTSIDLSNAYLHIPIHPNSRKYLRFCHRSQGPISQRDLNPDLDLNLRFWA